MIIIIDHATASHGSIAAACRARGENPITGCGVLRTEDGSLLLLYSGHAHVSQCSGCASSRVCKQWGGGGTEGGKWKKRCLSVWGLWGACRIRSSVRAKVSCPFGRRRLSGRGRARPRVGLYLARPYHHHRLPSSKIVFVLWALLARGQGRTLGNQISGRTAIDDDLPPVRSLLACIPILLPPIHWRFPFPLEVL